ncbi:MAG: DUF6705 family protein [Bacteroidota bacterium]
MKYLIAFCFVLLVNQVSFGQKPQAGDYITKNYINKYEGTWMWTSGSDTVIFKLKKLKYTYTSPAFDADVLLGCHTYIQTGVLVESSMNKYDSIVNYNKHKLRTVTGWNDPAEDTSKVSGILWDITKNKRVGLTLQYIAGSPPQLQLEMKALADVILDPTPLGATLPTNMVFIKQ